MDPAKLLGPAAAPPNNHTLPNFIDPPNGNAASVAVIIICLVVSTFFLTLRLYSRVVAARQLRAEDAIGFAAFGFFVGMIWAGLSLWKTIGFFVQQYNVRLGSLFDALFVTYLFPLFYALTMMTIKTSILLEWLHIFVPARTKNKFFWICWAMIIANCALYISIVIAVQFYCTPVEKNWHRWIPGTCRDRGSIDTTPSIFNLIFDVLILLLPQRVIWKLQMDSRRKIGVSIVFSVGLLACICAAARIAYTIKIDYKNNVTYDIGPVYLWALAECTCGIIVFSVPALPKAFNETPLLKNTLSYIKPLFSTFSRSSNKKGSSNMSGSGFSSGPSVQSSRVYRKMSESERGITLTEVQNESAGSLPLNDRDMGYAQDNRRSGPGIVRTTEVRTAVRDAPADMRDEWNTQQPWDTRGAPPRR